MISTVRNNRSLTFYQNITLNNRMTFASSCSERINATTISSTVYDTATTTTQFNNQLNDFLNNLHTERYRISHKVINGLAKDSSYIGARNDGVNLAWKYEKADIDMNGRGSTRWNKEQLQEIRETGKVMGAEGHHQKNVANHQNDQGNPDNIKFYKTRKEHLEQGHDGNYQNETYAEYIDKDKMLKNTNSKRVFKSEIKGIGIAAAIGAGVGFLIGFTVSLAQSGITPESLKYALINGGRESLSSGVQSVTSYGIGRTIGQFASHALEGVLSNLGIEITTNVSKMCSMGIVGGITISVFLTYRFIKLISNGIDLKEALIQVGRKALTSFSMLAVSIALQAICGGIVLIITMSASIIFITYSITNIVYQRKLLDKIRIYMINQCKPLLI